MKNNLKTIIASSVAALAFGAVSVGTTFALFTDKDDATIEVNSGKIDVTANVNDIKVYSAVFEDEDNYYEELQTATEDVGGLTHHLFSNGGYAAFDSEHKLVIIDRITPGDLVKFTFDVGGDSTVAFKYRFSYTVVDTDEDPTTSYLDLVKGMDTTIKVGEEEGVEYHGLAKYQSVWELKTPEDELEDVEFTLALPVEAGNEYQEKEAKILIAFEAVQGNAYTEGDAEVILVEEDIVSEPSIAVEDQPTTIVADSSSSDLSFEVTVPANAAYSGGTVHPDDKLTIEVTDLGKTEEVYSTETSLNFDLTLKVNNQAVNGFSEPLDVSIYVGPSLIISSVSHNETEVEDYHYDPVSGYITFQTNSFSPFEVSFLSGVEVRNQTEMLAALANGGKIGVKADIVMNQFMPVNSDTTIIGFDHTITFNANRGVRIQTNDVELNIANLTFVGGTGNERCVQVDSNKQNVAINLENVDMLGFSMYAFNVCANSTVNVNINECEIEGYGAINIWSDGYVINITNSKLVGINNKGYNAEGWNDFGVVILEGDTTGAFEAHASNNIVKISDTEVVAKVTTGNTQYFFLFNAYDANNSIILKNVTLTDVIENGNTEFSLLEGDSNVITGDYYYGGEHHVI